MNKYLLKASYTQGGLKGVLAEGGTGRRNAVEKLIQNMGGTIESFYFGFGEEDVYVVCGFPTNVDMAAVAINVGAAGGATVKTTVLLTPEEVDQAIHRTVEYRAPGQ